MLKRKNTLINALLTSESDARQLRTLKGKCVNSNELGTKLFSAKADPFAFLKDTLQPEKLERLCDAYVKAQATSVRLETPLSTYEIAIRRLPHHLLLIAKDISERIQMEALLTHEQERLQDSLSNLAVGVYLMNAEGNLIYVNETLAGWIGLTPDKLTHHFLSDFVKSGMPEFSDLWTGEVHFTSRKRRFKSYVMQKAMDEMGQTLFTGVVLPSSFAHTQQSAQNSQFYFQKAPLGILVVDSIDLTVIKINEALKRNLNQTALPDCPLMHILDKESQEILPLKLSKLVMRAQKFEKCELTFEFPNQEAHTFMAYIAPIEKDGDITSFVFYLTDLDERKTLQMQMLHAQKMQAMGQLAGGVAHDFNNLLTAIIGFSDLLLQRHTQGDPSFSDIMQIKNNANRAAGLVGRLLTFSRKQPLKPKLLDMADEFSDLSSLLKRSIGAKVELKTDFPADLGYVKVDPQQLMQVFLNLAVNARDAMPNGGVLSITCHTEVVDKAKTLGADIIIPGEYIVIDVADTGCGIPKENLNRIFDPFFSTKEGIAGSGTGLGLSTVYGIITQTDGYIYVTSSPNVGTTFTIYLPRFANAGLVKDKKPKAILPVAMQKANVLLVEDEEAVRFFASRVLKNKGFNVIECANAEDALKELKSDTSFDLMLTDMVMPGMDGETLCSLAKERYPSLRVILMSGYSEDFARHGKDEAKDFSFLPKPFSLSQLVLKVREVLQ